VGGWVGVVVQLLGNKSALIGGVSLGSPVSPSLHQARQGFLTDWKADYSLPPPGGPLRPLKRRQSCLE